MVDTQKSTIQWTDRNPYTSHFGHIQIDRGEIQISGGILNGSFDIDMNSITNLSLEGDESQPVLIDHLKSEDFFLTTLFPTATYEILSGRPIAHPYLSAPNVEVKGHLKLRGIKASQDFMATVTPTAEDGLAMIAHFDLDRTRWNIIYGSTRFFEHLGMHLVFDMISFDVRILAN